MLRTDIATCRPRTDALDVGLGAVFLQEHDDWIFPVYI